MLQNSVKGQHLS